MKKIFFLILILNVFSLNVFAFTYCFDFDCDDTVKYSMKKQQKGLVSSTDEFVAVINNLTATQSQTNTDMDKNTKDYAKLRQRFVIRLLKIFEKVHIVNGIENKEEIISELKRLHAFYEKNKKR